MARKTLEQFEHQFQEYLEKLKVAEYTQMNKVYQDIGRLLTQAVNELGKDISDLRRVELQRFLKGVATKQKKLMDATIKKHIDRTVQFGAFSYQIEASLLHHVTGAAIAHSTKAKAIYQAALNRPLGATGDLLDPFIKNLSNAQVSIVEKTLRKAHINGWTSRETLQVLKGTAANKFADGLMSRLGKQTATVVRTGMQHINNSARQTVWADNADIVVGYRWVSTLDDRTSEECQELDGEVFKLDEGPIPPAHPNCRSTTIAELDPAFNELDAGATRSSAEGYVPMDMKYADWLAGQDEGE